MAISGLPYFQALRPDEIVRVADIFAQHAIAGGDEVIIGPDDPVELALVVTGTVTLELPGERRRLYPGDRYGDLSVDTHEARPARLTADVHGRPAEVALLDRDGLARILDEFPATALPLCEEIAGELKWKNDLLRDLEVIHQEGLADRQRESVLASRRRKLKRRRRHVIRAASRALFRRLVLERGKEPAFWVLTGFLVALATARTVVRTIITFNLQKKLFALIPSPGGLNPVHVHHFNYGIALVVIVGVLVLLPRGRRMLRLLGFAFGAGLGLIVDEFALLWHLHPDYYQRASYIAIVVSALGLMQIIYFRAFYLGVARRIAHRVQTWRA
ncbi:MAG TPA: hypothetical protein VGQ83_12155 [Polyangia bacterium]